MLSETEEKNIEAAIQQAEAKTTAEISCIVAKSVSSYPEVSLAWGAVGSLLLLPVIVWLLHPAMAGPLQDWSASPIAASGVSLATRLSRYALLQAAVFLLVVFVTSLPAVRPRVTPHFWKRKLVHQAAYAQYLATGLHQSRTRTGVVIFACLEDRCVSVIADELIHKAVGAPVWERAVAVVQDGMRTNAGGAGLVQAIEICGDALARHFPGQSPNLLSDRPLEL